MKKFTLLITLSCCSLTFASSQNETSLNEWLISRMAHPSSLSTLDSSSSQSFRNDLASPNVSSSTEGSPLSRKQRKAEQKYNNFLAEIGHMNHLALRMQQTSSEKEKHVMLGNRRK